MLWALKRVGSLAISESTIDENSGELSEATLILEPADGGDQQEEFGIRRVVVQLKARSDDRTWSLQDLVTEVLPDLYRAVDLTRPETTYCFVTEGRRGDWGEAEDFFRSFNNRLVTEDALASLSDSKEVKFGKRVQQPGTEKKPFWDPGPYTERGLFDRIVAYVRSRAKNREEPVAQTRQRLWHLLANFEFEPGNTWESIQEAVDNWLVTIVPALEDLPRFRDALLLDLARRASSGSAPVVATEFLDEHGLNATPLSKWMELTSKATHHLVRTLQLRGIDFGEEARPGLVDLTFGRWMSNGPILILSGESGQGKTWLGYSLLWEAVRRQEIAIAIESEGNAHRDQDVAARVFWQEIVGHDNAPPFLRIRERLHQVGGEHGARRIALLVDRVYDHTEARRLTLVPWEDLGIRVAITCLPDVEETICAATEKDRCAVVSVQDFTVGELQMYLASAIGDHWTTIPEDVRNTLRRPLLAHLYRDLTEGQPWQPTNEYELYERFWQRLSRSEHGSFPADAAHLCRVAYSVVQGETYPWSTDQLVSSGMDNDCIERLTRIGWLRSRYPGRYEVWHERLLNWAAAEGIIAEVRVGRLSEMGACETIKTLHFAPPDRVGPHLGYVAMDAFWIASSPGNNMVQFATGILRTLESRQ
ncbi:MAG: hypothetical protein HQ582_17975 [Planctomycetes bacterium]|nr:hypothetical protein [Planctomycetota bacterium]